MQIIEKEPGREYKLQQYRKHMTGLRATIKAIGNLTLEEAGDENITIDLTSRRDFFEFAAGIIKRDLGMKTSKKYTRYKP